MKELKKDRRKVVIIVTAIVAVVTLFAVLSRRRGSDPVVDPTPSAETSAPAKKSSQIPKTAYPTKGKYVEAILPRDEAEEAVAEGALSESAVGDMESKKYNSYSLEKDLQLAGPEQQQEVASKQEVTDALTVQSSPAPTATPDSAVQQAQTAAAAQKQTADNAAVEAQQAAEAAEAAAKAKAEAEAKAAADAAAKAEAEAAARAEAEAAQAAAEAQQKAYAEAQAAAEAQQAAEAAAQAAKDQEVEAERQRICEASGGSYEHGACAYQQDDIEVISAEDTAPADASPAAE